MFSSDFSEVNGRYGSGQEVLSGRSISFSNKKEKR